MGKILEAGGGKVGVGGRVRGRDEEERQQMLSSREDEVN